MAAKPAQKPAPKVKKGDIEAKGKGNNSKKKRTSIGASKNSRPNNKTAAREKKGR